MVSKKCNCEALGDTLLLSLCLLLSVYFHAACDYSLLRYYLNDLNAEPNLSIAQTTYRSGATRPASGMLIPELSLEYWLRYNENTFLYFSGLFFFLRSITTAMNSTAVLITKQHDDF